jgi:ribose transport system permease protein
VRQAALFLQRYGVLVAFLLLFLVSAIWRPDVFLQPENLRNLVNQNVPVGIIAIGMTLVIVTGGIDLSVGSLAALAAALGLTTLNRVVGGGGSEEAGTWAAAAVCLTAGFALGAWNGFLVAWGRVAPFIATLVGLVAFRSLTLALAEGGEIRSLSADVFPALGRGGIPIPFVRVAGDQPLILTWGILAFILVALLGGLLLNWTRFGRYATAVGANERAARYSAVHVPATKFWVYAVTGLFTGLAALILASRFNSVASSSMGLYYELDAIAAVVIGGTTLRGGYARIWGTVVGVLLLGIITNMLVIAGVSVYWQGVVKGAIILAAVLIQRGARA